MVIGAIKNGDGFQETPVWINTTSGHYAHSGSRALYCGGILPHLTTPKVFNLQRGVCCNGLWHLDN